MHPELGLPDIRLWARERMKTLIAIAAFSAAVLPLGVGASPPPSVTNSEVNVGSPAGVTPPNHQNEPAVAMDAHNPDVLVAGSNDYIDQQACPQALVTQRAVCDDFSAGI